MNKTFVKRTTLFTVSLSFLLCSVFAQQWHLSEKINKSIIRHCAICSKSAAASSMLSFSAHENMGIRENFHNCHVSLANNQVNEGYRYALKTITGFTAGSFAGDSAVLISAMFLKAKILYYKGINAQALQEYRLLKELNITDKEIAANIYSNMAEIYLEQRNFDTSLLYFNEWQKQFLSVSDPYNIKSVYSNTATCLLHLQRFKESYSYYQKSLDISIQIKDTLGLAKTYLNIANWYYEQYRDNEAIPYYKKSLLFALKSKDYEIARDLYRSIAQIEEDAKRYASALEYRKQYEALVDSIWNRDKVFQIAALEKKIAVQQQEHRVRSLQQEGRAQAAELSKKKWQRNTLFVIAVFFLTSAGFAYFAYHQKNKQHFIIAAQKDKLDLLNETKDQLFSIVAHDLRAPVNNLKIQLSYLKTALVKNRIAEATLLSARIENISNGTYALLNNLLYWALSQTGRLSFTRESLNLHVVADQVCYDYMFVATAKNISITNDTPDDLYFYADLNSVKIIFRNLLDNAIKYTPQNGAVIISAQAVNNECRITVKDTGIGMDEQTINAIEHNDTRRINSDTSGYRSTGLGLWLSRTMAEKNGGRLHVISSKGAGTRIIVILTLTV